MELAYQEEDINQMASQKMQRDNKYCYQWIRKCPYCGEYWIRDSVCSGATICRSLPDQNENFNNQGSNIIFKFQFTENSVTYSYNNVGGLQQQRQKRFLSSICQTKRMQLIYYMDHMYPLSQSEINVLFDIGVINYFQTYIHGMMKGDYLNKNLLNKRQ